MKSNKFKNGDIFVKIALSMLFLITVTFGINKDLYAKFITKDSANDNATVAKFEITTENVEGEEVFFENVKIDFKQKYDNNANQNIESRLLKITNNSEVAVEMDFTVLTTGNLPLSFYLEESSNATMTSPTALLDSTVGVDTTIGSGNLIDGLYSATSITTGLDIGETMYIRLTISLEILDAKYSGFVDLINFKVSIEQVD